MNQRQSMMRRAAILAMVTGLIMPAPAVASDRDIQAQLQEAYVSAGWRDVRVAVDHSVVTLTGEVPHVWRPKETPSASAGTSEW